MNLKILLPFQVFADIASVSRIVIPTHDGSYGLLPRRRDCVSALAPGILIYQLKAQSEDYVAVDQGVLVKTGTDVLVSVRRAIRGPDLRRLRAAIENEFLTLDQAENSARSVMARLEAGFLRRLSAFQHG
jgi:F-type H+-transporting ATPase subunit epsilon